MVLVLVGCLQNFRPVYLMVKSKILASMAFFSVVSLRKRLAFYGVMFRRLASVTCTQRCKIHLH
jgi:hypothetical protein